MVSPFLSKQGVDCEIDVVIIEPLRLAQNTLKHKPKSVGNSAASRVAGRTVKNNPIQLKIFEGMINHSGNCHGHDSAALMPCVEPVSQFGLAVHAINKVLTQHAYNSAAVHHHEGLTISVIGSSPAFTKKLVDVLRPRCFVQPGKPLAQVRSVRLHQSEKFGCVHGTAFP